MNQLLDLAYDMVTAPSKALSVIVNEEKLKEAFLLWLFVVFVISLSIFQQGPGLLLQFLGLLVFMGAALLIHSAVTDYISGLFGGMGTARGITAGFMAASLPLSLSVVFTFIEAIGVTALSGIGGFVLFLWSFYLDVAAISENYNFHKGKAFLIALAPYVLTVIFLILLAALGVASALAGISGIDDLQGIESMIGQM
ncbi:YIP1 family protein [Dialister sp.]|uniref:YIP1 family protein n=1 Tax=Dialister sp. TaxID=1955814 RepID=UPI002E81EFD9|nr:YIP1 family protein [Dialister sp.]MEE3452472.1 YIP1 family protein [Dialister sp.]